MIRAATHSPETGRCTRCDEAEPNHKPNCIHFEYGEQSKALAVESAKSVRDASVSGETQTDDPQDL